MEHNEGEGVCVHGLQACLCCQKVLMCYPGSGGSMPAQRVWHAPHDRRHTAGHTLGTGSPELLQGMSPCQQGKFCHLSYHKSNIPATALHTSVAHGKHALAQYFGLHCGHELPAFYVRSLRADWQERTFIPKCLELWMLVVLCCGGRWQSWPDVAEQCC